MARAKNFNQVIRIDGKNCFVEFMDNAFEIEKVLINFVSYDEKTKKQTAIIPFYLDFSDFLVLSADVLSGRIFALIKKEKEKGQKYPQPIYTQQGGVSANNLEKRNQKRPDGMSLARQLKIVPGLKYPVVLQGEQGKGEETDKGLIVARYGSKPEKKVMIPMQSDDLKKVVLMVQAKINAFFSAQYVYMRKTEFNRQLAEEAKKRESFQPKK